MPDQKSPITLSQIAASALAASSAAFAASYLGVTGTIIGAAVASVIATVASALYGASLDRSTAAVRRTTRQFVRVPNRPATPEPPAPQRFWTRTALAATAVLGITLSALTGMETLVGKPLAALLGDADAAGTSLGSAVAPEPGGTAPRSTTTDDATEPPAPAPEPTPVADPTAVPTDEPTPTPTPTPTTEPTTEPTPEPTPSTDTAPSAGPTTAPTASG